MKRPWAISAAVLAVLGLVGLFFGRDLYKMVQMGDDGVPVRMEPAVRSTLVEVVSAPGIVEPVQKVDISAEVSARIMELPSAPASACAPASSSCGSTTVT